MENMAWSVTEEKFESKNLALCETLYSQGNGYLGTRGTFEEGYLGFEKDMGVEGTYINGFYETADIHYEEGAYGFAEESQTMLNLPNAKKITLYLGEEPFTLASGKIIKYKRVFDLKRGVVTRTVHWQSPGGMEVLVEIRRLISFTRHNIMAIEYSVTLLNSDRNVSIVSQIDTNVTNVSKTEDPRIGSNLKGRVLKTECLKNEDELSYCLLTTIRTQFSVCTAMSHEISPLGRKEISAVDDVLSETFHWDARKGSKITCVKYIAYGSHFDQLPENLTRFTKNILLEAKSAGFEKLIKEQEAYLEDFWYRADVQIYGQETISQGIRFNLLHLLQGVGRQGKTGIAAKGLSGEGYEGHYFWESETYILPLFLYSKPELAKSLLMYRYNTMDNARKIARTMSHKGAMFPWRTINGNECSAYFLAGTAQYHITGGIAYAIKRYFESTEDIDFMIEYGAEMLAETARFWASVGHFNPRKNGEYCIDCVTGPDEYTALVNNNCYTNVLAAENMLFSYKIVSMLREKYPEAYKSLVNKISLEPQELQQWKTAGEKIHLPYDETLKIYKQDDTFLDKKLWDFQNTPKNKYPLLLHFHPIIIYRHQVSKQPDLLLIEVLARHRFNKEQIKRDYAYYAKVITHDSSLSESICSIAACMVGDYGKAFSYFLDTVRLDLDNTHHNTKDGLHMANMAGSWATVVNGFAGMYVNAGRLIFEPHLPEGWDGYCFKLCFRNRLIQIEVTSSGTDFKLLEGEPVTIVCNNETISLKRLGDSYGH